MSQPPSVPPPYHIQQCLRREIGADVYVDMYILYPTVSPTPHRPRATHTADPAVCRLHWCGRRPDLEPLSTSLGERSR